MSSTSKRLTLEQTVALAAHEVQARERVYLAEDVPSALREHLHADAHVVSGRSSDAVDVAILRARCVTAEGRVCTPAVQLNGGDPFAHVPEARRVVVLLLANQPEDPPAQICGHGDAGTLRAQRIITDLAVLDVRSEGLQIRMLAPGVSARDVQDVTNTPLIADHTLDELEI